MGKTDTGISIHDKPAFYQRFLRGSETGEDKTVYVMAGIPGSGKSTFVNRMIGEGKFPARAFILNPDLVMEAMKEYQEAVEVHGYEQAFARWELPARELAYELLGKAVQLGLAIIIDMGMARPEGYGLLNDLKSKHGYYLKMYWLELPAALALERIRQRKRHTPESMVYEREAALKSLQPKYQALVDEFYFVK